MSEAEAVIAVIVALIIGFAVPFIIIYHFCKRCEAQDDKIQQLTSEIIQLKVNKYEAPTVSPYYTIPQ